MGSQLIIPFFPGDTGFLEEKSLLKGLIMTSKKKVLLGSFHINFDEFDEKDWRGKYLYESPHVVSVRRMSVYLPGWNGEEITAVNEQLNIYTDAPITCKDTCPFSSDCPLVQNGLVSRWRNKPCPIDSISAFRKFAGYINDLDIKPEDYTDINMVNDLVRLHLQMDRCDKLIRNESPLETMVAGTDAKTTLKHAARQPNQYLEVQRRIRADIASIYKQLMASRQSKSEQLKTLKKADDISSVHSDLLNYAKNMENSTEARIDKLELNKD